MLKQNNENKNIIKNTLLHILPISFMLWISVGYIDYGRLGINTTTTSYFLAYLLVGLLLSAITYAILSLIFKLFKIDTARVKLALNSLFNYRYYCIYLAISLIWGFLYNYATMAAVSLGTVLYIAIAILLWLPYLVTVLFLFAGLKTKNRYFFILYSFFIGHISSTFAFKFYSLMLDSRFYHDGISKDAWLAIGLMSFLSALAIIYVVFYISKMLFIAFKRQQHNNSK